MKFLSAFTLLANAVLSAQAFKMQLKDTLPVEKILVLTEGYMFVTAHGPPMLEQGEAYIQIDASVLVYMKSNTSVLVGYAIFAAEEDHQKNSLIGICDEGDVILNNPWARKILRRRVSTSYVGQTTIFDPAVGPLGDYYLWRTEPLGTKYPIVNQLWHNVNIQVCTSASEGPMAMVEGGVTFRNPYGFLPAEQFGFLPFEGARMVAYFFLGLVYIYFFFKHQESILPLHQGVLFVFVVALGEATCWYAAFQNINLTGQPFPKIVVASLVLQIFRQTFARSLLLVVSLGYGIVRPKLLSAEWVAVSVVSTFYLGAAIVAQVSTIVMMDDMHGDAPKSVLSYQIPELIMDVIFLSWIYLALGSTIRILTEFQQGYKLNLYKQLAFVMALFVSLFMLASVLILLDKSGFIEWPWQWAWAQQVLWEVLNFAVLAAVCIICCPSDNSRRLSYASQLPTDDPDDEDYSRDYPDDDFEDEGVGRGFTDEDQAGDAILGSGSKREEADAVEMSTWRSKLSSGIGSLSPDNSLSKGSHKFTSLPAADDDDEEFGLDEAEEGAR